MSDQAGKGRRRGRESEARARGIWDVRIFSGSAEQGSGRGGGDLKCSRGRGACAARRAGGSHPHPLISFAPARFFLGAGGTRAGPAWQ